MKDDELVLVGRGGDPGDQSEGDAVLEGQRLGVQEQHSL